MLKNETKTQVNPPFLCFSVFYKGVSSPNNKKK